MNAHITDKEHGMAQIEALWKSTLAMESAKAGILIGNAALHMAVSIFGDRIRNGTLEESHQAALEMLDWCSAKKTVVDFEELILKDEQPTLQLE